jgi:hypothetical protein
MLEGMSDAETEDPMETALRLGMAKDVLRRAIASGEVRPSIDLDDVVDAMYGPIIYRLLVYRELKDGSSIERYADPLIEGLLTRSRRHSASYPSRRRSAEIIAQNNFQIHNENVLNQPVTNW